MRAIRQNVKREILRCSDREGRIGGELAVNKLNCFDFGCMFRVVYL